MAKRTKRKHVATYEDHDKPAYAMDVVKEPVKVKPEKPKEEAFHVGETVDGSIAQQLEKLKAQLVEQSEPKVAAPPKKAERGAASKKPAEERLAENPNLSFAELFDPQDDEDASFKDLLDESKLDWRFFKDE